MRLVRTLLWIGVFLASASAGVAQNGMDMATLPTRDLPRESGQGAFAAIHEIVGRLEADPQTDWSKVNIDALRQHLIDMDNVVMHARIAYQPVTGGEHIHVSGDGAVRDSIQRMVTMHAAMAGDTPDWHMTATAAPDGVDIALTAKSPHGLQKMKALGLIGMLAEGDHHSRHHLMLATGAM
jgi:hypothetical protein